MGPEGIHIRSSNGLQRIEEVISWDAERDLSVYTITVILERSGNPTRHEAWRIISITHYPISAFTMMETRLELVPIKRSVDGPPRSKFCWINVGRDLVLIRSAYCRIYSHGPGLGRRWFNSAGSLAIVGCSSGVPVAPEVSQIYSETPQPPSIRSLFSKTFSFTSLDRASRANRIGI